MSALLDPRKHDDFLNFQLKRLLSIGGAPAIRLCEGRFGVPRKEWRLLAALVEEGPMSPSELARRCWPAEPGSVSRITAILVEKKLVRRVPLASDHRRATLEATAAGRRLYAELFPQLAAINRRIMAALDESEALLLEAFLRKLTERAAQIHDEGDGVDVRADRRHGGSRRLWNRV
jgi:DNA-binding MarR family transcriptional regulator